MPRTVVKHSYCSGKRGKEAARRHINYIAYRAGEDREKEGRKFFDQTRDNIDIAEVKQSMYEHAGRNLAMHKLILSPGRQDVDIHEYTREVMHELGREKGMKFDWKAVVHDNTEHIHAHVCLMAKSEDGRFVKLTKEDHHRAREIGDDYIYREFGLDRLIDREKEETRDVRDVLKGDDREFRTFIEREAPDLFEEKKPYKGKTDLYEPLFSDPKEKKKERDPDQDRLDYEKFDRDLKQSLDPDHSPRRVSGRQILRETQGAMSEFHGDYNKNMEKQRLNDLLSAHPEMKESIDRELEALKDFHIENRPDAGRELERFLEGMDYSDHVRKQKELQERPGETPANAGAKDPSSDPAGPPGNGPVEATQQPSQERLPDETSTNTASPNDPKEDRNNDPGITSPEVRTDVIGGKPQRDNEDERDRDDDRGLHQ